MVKHFESRAKARKYKDNQNNSVLNTYKKLKGHKNRVKKPFVVCSYIEWLNLY